MTPAAAVHEPWLGPMAHPPTRGRDQGRAEATSPPVCRVLRLDDAPEQPWRNGGGVTRELLAWPGFRDDGAQCGAGQGRLARATDTGWRVRVSVADIHADGPFSAFPGVTRWFCVLEGEGVELVVNGLPRRLRMGDPPCVFDGAANTQARLLAGPTRDLNLMVAGPRAAMQPASEMQAWRPPSGPCGLFAWDAGCLSLHGLASGPADRADPALYWDLPPRSLAWFEQAPGELRYSACQSAQGARAWWLWAGSA